MELDDDLIFMRNGCKCMYVLSIKDLYHFPFLEIDSFASR